MLFAVLLISLVLQALDLTITRLLEGYWERRPARWLAELLKLWHQWRWYRLQARAEHELPTMREGALWQMRYRYPAPDRMMPTGLGNVLRAAEDRAGQTYGLQTVEVWPRLFPLLSERLTAIVEDERNQLDLAVRLCFVFMVGALASATVLIRQMLAANTLADRWKWLVIPAANLVLSLLSYRGAVSGALLYGTGLDTAFALHRFDLLVALHLPLPQNLDQERRVNGRISNLFQYGAGSPAERRAIVYCHPAAREGQAGAADATAGPPAAASP